MELVQEAVDGVHVLKPIGDLTNHSAPKFRKAQSAILESGNANIILNLGEIGLLSSIGIREIMALYKHCGANGGKLVLCALTDQVYDILDTTGLMTVFTVCDSQADALASF